MKKQVFLWCVVAVFLAAGAVNGSAATFEFVGGGFHSQSHAEVSYSLDPHTMLEDDSGTQSNSGTDWAESHASAHIVAENFAISASGSGHGGYDMMGPNQVSVHVYAQADAYSDMDGAWMAAYGNANTVEPMVTTGIFFEVMPEEGEMAGQQVTVSFDWFGEAQADTFGTVARLNSGYDGAAVGNTNMSITVNDFPSSDPADNRVWERAEMRADEMYMDDVASGFFTAQVGDIIGIHLGATVDLMLFDQAYEVFAYASSGMTLEVGAAETVPVPGAFILLGSGLIGLMGVRRNNVR